MVRRVIQAQIGAKGKIRNKPIKPELYNLLSAVGEELDVYIEVGSGGQTSDRDPKLYKKPGGWTGSHRHDEGGAADLRIFKVDADGGKHFLSWSDPADQKVWSDVVRLSKAGGATGFGAGTGYMGNQTVHIGYGSKKIWNPSGPVPDWLTKAVKAGETTPPMPIPDATVPKIVDVTAGGTLPSGAKIPANPFAGTAREGDGAIKGIVFHHTGGTDLSGAMVTGQQPGPQYGFGAQYYIDTDGTIYRYAPDTAKMLNIRSPGKEGRTDAGLPTEGLSNDNVIGVEVVGADSDSFTQAQKDAAADLAGYLSSEYSIDPTMIVGHGELQGGEGGSKMPTEGVEIAFAARDYVLGGGNSALGAIEAATGAPVPFPAPSFRSRLDTIRADRDEQLRWGEFTRAMDVPLPAPRRLDEPLPEISPTVDNDNGGMVFAPNTGDLGDIMRERYGPTYETGGAGDASIYEQLGLPAPTAAPPAKPYTGVRPETEDKTRDEQRQPAPSPIGQPPTKRKVETIRVTAPPADGLVVTDTGTTRLGRPVVVVDDEPVIERAPPPPAVPRETIKPMLPPAVLNGNLLTQGDLTWTPPKTLADALAGTNYASAEDLSKAGFALDNDPHIAPRPDFTKIGEGVTRTEQRQMQTRPPSQAVIKPPAPGEVMKPDDYKKLVERGTEESKPNPDLVLPRKVGWNENWIDRGKRQGRLVPAPDPKIAPTPAPEPKFRRRVIETVRNPKYDEWAAKYAKATEGGKAWSPDDANDYARYGAPGGVDNYDERSTIPKPEAPIVPPAPNRTIQVERDVPIPPAPRPRPSGVPPAGDYIIERGDTLSAIAAKTGVPLAELQRANGITDPNKIYAGNKLVIPGRSSGGTQPAPTPSRNTGAPVPKPSSTTRATPVYVNKAGQTLKPQTVKIYDADSNSWVDRTVYKPA